MTHRIALSAALFICLFVVGCSQPASRTGSANHSHTSGTGLININTATVEELQRVPFIGERTAVAIVEFRQSNGPFRRPQHLMQVRGISDKRFREIRHLIRTE